LAAGFQNCHHCSPIKSAIGRVLNQHAGGLSFAEGWAPAPILEERLIDLSGGEDSRHLGQ
jgi:hypothetical protein